MNLFEKVPDNFFSILASKNKNIYGVALVTLYDALTMYRTKLRKSDYLDLLKSRSGDIVSSLEFEGDEFDESSIEPTLANKANAILKRLVDTGWVYIDYDVSKGCDYLLLPSYSINMLEMISQFSQTTNHEYVSYVHSTYSDLKLEDETQDESMYKSLENAYNNTQKLEIQVTKLDHSLRVFNHQLSSMFEPNEVLKQHFDICREDVVDPIYHPLKTHDSITLYQGPINSILKKWLLVDEVREKLIAQALKENHTLKNHDDGEHDVIKKITYIQDTYYRLAQDISKIDETQSNYIKNSTDKVIFLNNNDKTIKGKLEKIFLVLAKNLNGDEEINRNIPDIRKDVVRSISLYQQGYIDKESITKPYKRTEHEFSDPMEIDMFEHSYDDSALSNLVAESSRYSDENVMEFMARNFKDKNEITAKDVDLKNVEDFIFLILGTIKSTSRISFYDAIRDEEKLDINIIKDDTYSVPDFKYSKKGE